MNTTQRCKANKTPTMRPNDHRLRVTLSELTLAKRPAEFKRITELHAAIKALARDAARADHATKP
jgi:hypothetical protein